jgi:TPR repeat protein
MKYTTIIGVILFIFILTLIPCNAKESLQEVRTKANKGDVESQLKLANTYFTGEFYNKSIPKDFFIAVEWFEKAAKQGNTEAQFKLFILGSEEGYVDNPVEWMLKADKKITERLHLEAPKWLIESAEQGYKEAQFYLARMYMKGNGVYQNTAEALKWYKKAAEKGHEDALDILARMYLKGNAVPQDTTEAIKLYKKEAEQQKGGPDPMYIIAKIYYEGEGIPKNYTKAIRFYIKAAKYGHPYAPFKIGLMYDRGEGILQDYTKAMKWYSRGIEHWRKRINNESYDKYLIEDAEKGNIETQIILGYLYYKTQKYTESVEWCLKTAEQGCSQPLVYLGHMYYKGQGVQKNHEKAIKWYKEAAKRGDAVAQYSLANGYMEGKGVPQNYNNALEWYEKAAEQGHPEANLVLGDIYFKGRIVPQNQIKSYSLLNIAAALENQDAKHKLSNLEKKMKPEQIAKGQKQAEILWNKIQTHKN